MRNIVKRALCRYRVFHSPLAQPYQKKRRMGVHSQASSNDPDNIAEAAHQRAGSGSCGHPRRSRQRTGGESANWLCAGTGFCRREPHCSRLVPASLIIHCNLVFFVYFFNFLYFESTFQCACFASFARKHMHSACATVTNTEQSMGLQSWNKSVQVKKTCTLLRVCMCNCPFFYIND